ncbi:MAG: hypothetical protein AAFO82_01605 [Bacteroidota bacterium]
MHLDKDDPHLEFNLARLEKRFKQRYEESVQKNLKRQQMGRQLHQTTLRSMKDNQKRMEMVKVLRFMLVER